MACHPILDELSGQLPETSCTFQYIQEAADFEKIAAQAQKDIACLENLEGQMGDDQSSRNILEQNGYKEWLKASDQDERLRVLGALHLIADVSEELAED
jgi:hypothetical protein